jgi:hypothetical protein
MFTRKLSLFRIVLLSWIFFCMSGCAKQTHLALPNLAQHRFAKTNGAKLDQISLEHGNIMYLQTLDPQKLEIDQLIGDIDLTQKNQGLYYPSKNVNSSPFFKRISPPEILKRYRNQYRSEIFSVINASFFEDYKTNTRLSFPIKINGKVVTTGNSPYGPIKQPANPYYRSIQLKVLTWDSNKVTISNYSPASGFPLNQSNIKNALVSYAYRDHPAYALSDDPENRYHVLGILNSNSAKKTNQLLIATTNQSTLENAANVLRQKGVKGDLMTIDGGISTYLWTAKNGDLVLPQTADHEKMPMLPHYLGFRLKH